MKKIFAIYLLSLVWITACTYTERAQEAKTAIRFTTKISVAPNSASNHQTRTNTDGSSWVVGDEVGIYVVNTGGNIATDVIEPADNQIYRATTNTPSSPLTATQAVYYPTAANVDIIAYYPQRPTPVVDPYTYKIDATQQIDMLYARKVNLPSSNAPVNLTFDHTLSKITFNVKQGTTIAPADVAGSTMNIYDMPDKADFALQDGTLSAVQTSATPLVPNKLATATANFDATFTAIVIPQAAGEYANRVLEFMVEGAKYIWDMPSTMAFERGVHYQYNVTLERTGVVIGTPTITDWDSSGAITDGEMSLDQVETIRITAGAFYMGSPASERERGSDETQHLVTLTQDFYMGKYLVTFEEYDKFCDATLRLRPSDSGWGRGNMPVINVNWQDAMDYCAWLSTETGMLWTLPTEAQWEYACRGDYPNKATERNTKPFGVGDGTKLYANMANFRGTAPYDAEVGSIPGYDGSNGFPNTYLGRTTPVGSYPPNNYGLYDMHGNVNEWCSDWYDSKYGSVNAADDATEPQGPATGTTRVLLDNSWYDGGSGCRSGSRGSGDPASARNDVGFRVFHTIN